MISFRRITPSIPRIIIATAVGATLHMVQEDLNMVDQKAKCIFFRIHRVSLLISNVNSNYHKKFYSNLNIIEYHAGTKRKTYFE